MKQARAESAKRAFGAAVCVAGRRESAEAGLSMLRAGGNAFDAVVAAGFMEAVIAPHMCGIGGYGGACIAYHAGEKRLVALDADAVAPSAAAATMFPVLPGRGRDPYAFPDARHKTGAFSIAVPGVLGGLLTMLESWGKLDRKTVIAPAIRRAREGVALSKELAHTWLASEAASEGRKTPSKEAAPGIIRFRALADTLEAIAEEGQALFYSGRIGSAIAGHVQRLGGMLTREDMANYRVLPVEPLTVRLGSMQIATPPPPSGGLSVLQMAALFDRLQRERKAGPPWSAREYHTLLEIDKVVWRERLTTLADPPAMALPPAELLTDHHMEALLARVLEGMKNPDEGNIIAPDPLKGTSHIAAGDPDGNLVSWTQTHGGGFGSGVMVKGTGVVLGHGMCRFEPRPGWANSIAPGKRPLHNMCPVVAMYGSIPVLAIGGAGGRTIVNNVAAVTIGMLVQKLPLPEVLLGPRLQCETHEPALLERARGSDVIESVRALGHEVLETTKDAGTVHVVSNGFYDPRVDPSHLRLIIEEHSKLNPARGFPWRGCSEPRLATSAAVGLPLGTD
jgi:gamma-glutamyltranspeptidase/glutathione hydrolase